VATARAALERELADARQAADLRLAADDQAHRTAITALEHRIEELEESGSEARSRASEAIKERDALTASLESERQRAAEASAAADARLSAVDGERVEAERAWLEAEARVTEATAERDQLASRMAAAGDESAAHHATVEALQRRVTELEDAIADRDELASRLSAAAGETAEQLATTEALSLRIAELEKAASAALARESAAVTDRDALSAAFEVERQRTAAAWADADARLTVIDGELAAAEQARLEAEERAEEAIADRDELGSRLAAAVKSVQGMNAAVDERLAAIDAKRARALQQAQERAEAATRERDALAAELAALGSAPAAVADPDAAQQLEVALARVHALELQLFARDRGPRDADVELGPLLPPEVVPPIERGDTPAKRYGFKPLKRVQVDRAPALLVDLSLTGAQVIFATSPEVGTMVTLTLLSDDEPCFCQGRLLWARREQTAKGRPYRYPAGIAFTSVDNAAVEAFIAEHAVDQD
jgi:chromosome segregation ATPase